MTCDALKATSSSAAASAEGLRPAAHQWLKGAACLFLGTLLVGCTVPPPDGVTSTGGDANATPTVSSSAAASVKSEVSAVPTAPVTAARKREKPAKPANAVSPAPADTGSSVNGKTSPEVVDQYLPTPDPAVSTEPSAEPSEPASYASSGTGILVGKGLASWYGGQFHGRLTASGERFDRTDLTAAHPSLPFGSRVCVRSATTGKTVVVRINDRGPFAPGRVIDLSQAAARELGMQGLGIKPVELWKLGSKQDDCPDDMSLTNLDESDDDRLAPASAKNRSATKAGKSTRASAGKKKTAASSSARKAARKR